MSVAARKRGGAAARVGATSAATIPAFSLYGETGAGDDDGLVHVETIAARSERYDWEIDRHVHHGLAQVLIVLAGAVSVRLDDIEVEPIAPCAVLVPPGTVHAFRFRPGTVGRVVTFAETRFTHGSPERAGLVASLFAAPGLVDLGGDAAASRRLEAVVAAIDEEFATRAPGWTTVLEAETVALLVLLARRHAVPRREARPEAELHARFRDLVEKRFAEHLAIGAYADLLGVTESRLDRAVRAITGASAFETVQDRLLLEARRKLVYIAAPVSKLAYELGFEDPAYFWRFFRRRTGMTPTEFRKAERRRVDGSVGR